MARARLVVSIALLAALLATAGALAWWSHATPAGATDAFPLEVVGPDGAPMLTAVVRAQNATALLVLQEGAAQAGVPLQLREYPGMGTYVAAIGPHHAEGSAGWVYEVRRDGAWIFGDRGAAQFDLREGDEVRWRWSAAKG